MSNNLQITLCQPSHPGNIGAAARAMKTMGLQTLALIQPKHFPDEEADARATHARDILAHASVYQDVQSATSTCALVLGTTARKRTLNWPVYTPKTVMPQILNQLQSQQKVAILFGNERTGLENHQLAQCHALIHIPTHPDCSALNLAAAVQILAYEFAQSQDTLQPHSSQDEPNATAAERDHFFAHFEQLLHAIDFFQAHNVSHIMQKLQCFLNRSQPKRSEIALFRGILSQCLKRLPSSHQDNAL